MAPKTPKQNAAAGASKKTPPAGLRGKRAQKGDPPRARSRGDATSRIAEKAPGKDDVKKRKSGGRASPRPSKDDPPDEEAFVVDHISEDDDDIAIDLPSWADVQAEVDADVAEEGTRESSAGGTVRRSSRSASNTGHASTRKNSRRSRTVPPKEKDGKTGRGASSKRKTVDVVESEQRSTEPQDGVTKPSQPAALKDPIPHASIEPAPTSGSSKLPAMSGGTDGHSSHQDRAVACDEGSTGGTLTKPSRSQPSRGDSGNADSTSPPHSRDNGTGVEKSSTGKQVPPANDDPPTASSRTTRATSSKHQPSVRPKSTHRQTTLKPKQPSKKPKTTDARERQGNRKSVSASQGQTKDKSVGLKQDSHKGPAQVSTEKPSKTAALKDREGGGDHSEVKSAIAQALGKARTRRGWVMFSEMQWEVRRGSLTITEVGARRWTAQHLLSKSPSLNLLTKPCVQERGRERYPFTRPLRLSLWTLMTMISALIIRWAYTRESLITSWTPSRDPAEEETWHAIPWKSEGGVFA